MNESEQAAVDSLMEEVRRLSAEAARQHNEVQRLRAALRGYEEVSALRSQVAAMRVLLEALDIPGRSDDAVLLESGLRLGDIRAALRGH